MRTLASSALMAFIVTLVATTAGTAQDAQPVPPPSAPVKPVLEVVMGEPQLEEIAKSLGLQHRTSVAVPSKLEFYSCVILNNENACTPKVVERLREYTRRGGGVVVLGAIPLRLVGKDPTESIDVLWGDGNMKQLADWLGCIHAADVQRRSMFAKCWGGTPAAIAARTESPLGTALKRGMILLQYRGASHYTMLADPDEFCEIVAEWRSERDENEGWTETRTIAALVRKYGEGRVYWQSVVDEPNYPRLKDLLRAGIWRAATGSNLPARLKLELPPGPGDADGGVAPKKDRKGPADVGKILDEGKKIIDKITGKKH